MADSVTRLPTAGHRPVRNNRVVVEDEGNVRLVDVLTRLSRPPERVLHQANCAGLTEVVVVGFDATGGFFFSASEASGADVLWVLEMAKKLLLEVGE